MSDAVIRALERQLASEPCLENRLRLYRENRRHGRPTPWGQFGFEPNTTINEINKTTRIYFIENKRIELETVGVVRIDAASVKVELVTSRGRVVYAQDKATLKRLEERGWLAGRKNGGVEGLKLDELVQEVLYEALT